MVDWVIDLANSLTGMSVGKIFPHLEVNLLMHGMNTGLQMNGSRNARIYFYTRKQFITRI